MKDEWDADLRTLEMVQADLRRRLDGLERQIALLRTEMATGPAVPEVPSAKAPEVAPAGTTVPDLAKAPGAPSEAVPATPVPPPSVAPVPTTAETPAARPPAMPPPLPVEALRAAKLPPRSDSPSQNPAPPSPAELPPALPSEKAAPVPPLPKIIEPAENLELKVGKYWLVRIGILVLLTGLVLLGNLAYQSVIVKLGAPGKLALLYLAGAALTAVGCWLERRMENVRNYARVLMAGGAATIYYTTYAAHFVPGLRVIESPLVGGAALLLLAGGLAWFATRRKVEGVAFTAVLLSYYTSAINGAENFTLFSNVVLTAVAVYLLARHKWFGVSWLSVIGSYASFAYWRFHSGGPVAGDFWFSQGFLVAYWVIFTGAVFLHRAGAFQQGHRELFLTINNAAFFVLFAPTFQSVYPRQFWLFAVVFGAVLIGLSQLARRMRTSELAFDGAYLAQGLIILAVGMVAKFTGYQLGVMLAIESSALLYFGKFRHGVLLRIASGLAAAGATYFALAGFFEQKPLAWLGAAFIGLVLIGNSLLLKRLRGQWPTLGWHWGAVGYAWAGLLVEAIVLAERFQSPGGANPRLFWIYPAIAVAVVFTLRFHRLPELAVGVQGYLTFALIGLSTLTASDGSYWVRALPVLLGFLAVMHWWQFEKFFSETVRMTWEGLNAVAVCLVLLLWISPDWQTDREMLTLVLTGCGVLVYGVAARARILAILSQGFTLAAAGLCFRALVWGAEPWWLTLAVIALVAAQIGAARLLPAKRQEDLLPVLICYRLVVLALVLAWLYEFVPEPWKFFVLALCGALVFIPAAMRKNPEFLAHAAILVLAGAVCYVVKLALGGAGSTGDFMALILVLGIQQAGKKWLSCSVYFPAEIQAALAVAALGGLWFQSSRWVWDGSSPVAITVVWAVLAFAALGAGFLLRERIYRLMGLLILAIAVGHVFFVDVWKLGQLAGILGIIGLALVLLALGFIYNRFAEQIKKWL
jgi:uncharacterized membrane protein